ncbi:MAG: hypothetical protein ABSH35_12995 [Isosphaeraceae bacterium]|jgi:hypothetical protein
MLPYNDRFTFDENIADLATAKAGHVRDLEDRRNRIASGPNHPELKANDLAAIDAHLDKARIHAHAAAAGLVYHDPSDPAMGCDATHQRWVSEARARGRLVNPSNYEPSLHASKGNEITVQRGSGAVQFGAPGSR